MTTTWLPTAQPWLPPTHDEQVVHAIRAFAEGVASAGQQQMVWRYLMYVTGASEEFADLSFRPDEKGGERSTVFAEGKRFVGLMIRKLLRPEFTPKPKLVAPTGLSEKLRARRRKKAA